MATPVKTGSNLPATATTITPAEPVHVVGPFGWVLIMAAGIGPDPGDLAALPASTPRACGPATATASSRRSCVLAAMALRTSLPKQPMLGLLGLCGILLVLFGVFLDNSTEVFVSEVVAGVVLLAGTGLYAAGRARLTRAGPSGLDQHLDRAPLVHRAVALGDLVQRHACCRRPGPGSMVPASTSSSSSGMYLPGRRHARRPGRCSCWNIRRTGSSTPCGTPTKPTVEPGRAISNAVCIDWSVPTHSSTASAPTPAGELHDRRDALLVALGDDVRWRRTLRAIVLARLVPRHRDDRARRRAPRRPARRTARPRRRRPRPPYRPGGRRPTPRRASRSASRRRGSAPTGAARRPGTPSVFTRLPSAWVTRAYSAWPLAVKPRLTQPDWAPARQCGQVLSQWSNGTTTKSPGRNDVTSAPTSSTTPTHSWPIVSPGVIVVLAAVRPQVRAADAAGDDLDDRVGRSGDRRVGDVGDPDVAGTVDRRRAHGAHPRQDRWPRPPTTPRIRTMLRYLICELPWLA